MGLLGEPMGVGPSNEGSSFLRRYSDRRSLRLFRRRLHWRQRGLLLGLVPDTGCGTPAPDCVVYLTLNPEDAAKRGDYGGERYEDTDFQTKVEKNFQQLREPSWRVMDASRSIPQIESDLLSLALEVIEKSGTTPLASLWTSGAETTTTTMTTMGAKANAVSDSVRNGDLNKENVDMIQQQPGRK